MCYVTLSTLVLFKKKRKAWSLTVCYITKSALVLFKKKILLLNIVLHNLIHVGFQKQ